MNREDLAKKEKEIVSKEQDWERQKQEFTKKLASKEDDLKQKEKAATQYKDENDKNLKIILEERTNKQRAEQSVLDLQVYLLSFT